MKRIPWPAPHARCAPSGRKKWQLWANFWAQFWAHFRRYFRGHAGRHARTSPRHPAGQGWAAWLGGLVSVGSICAVLMSTVLLSVGGMGAGLMLAGPSLALAATPPAATPPSAPGSFTLFRCGPDGRELRNTPCPRETAASELVRFAPDDADAARAAHERNRQEARLLDRQRQEREARQRHEQEALQQAPQAGALGPATAPSAATAHATASPRKSARHSRGKAPGEADPRTARASKPRSHTAPSSTTPPPEGHRRRPGPSPASGSPGVMAPSDRARPQAVEQRPSAPS